MLKKTTFLLLALLSVVGAKAVNLWTGEQEFANWSGDIQIATADLADMQAGATVSVTFERLDGASDTQIFIKSSANGWANISNDNACNGPVRLYGYQVNLIKENKLILQGTGVKVTSVDYENPATPLADNVVWLGPLAFDSWSATTTIAAPAFANAADGDQLKFIISGKTSDYNPVMKENGWKNFDELQDTKVDGDGYFLVTITSEALDELKANGLRLQGVGFTLEEVQYIQSEATDPNLLWEGEYEANWGNTAKATAKSLANAKVGDLIRVTFTDVNVGNHQLLIDYDWSKMLTGTYKGQFKNGETTYTFGVTEENIGQMKQTGFFATGNGLTITEIRLIPNEQELAANTIFFGDEITLNDAQNWAEFYGTNNAPEGAAELVLELEGTPNWMQLANSGWTALGIGYSVEGNEYAFPIAADLKETLSDFIIQGTGFQVKSISIRTLENENVQLNANGYASFSSPFALDFSATSTKAYTAKFDFDKMSVALTPIDVVPAETGVILKGQPGGTEEIPYYAGEVESVGENDLVATALKGIDVEENSVTILSTVEGNTGFYTFTGTYIPKGKAYYQGVAPEGSAAKGLSVVFETTGIESTLTKAQGSRPAIYNLNGQRVDSSFKGIIVVNGKKMMNK